MSQPLETYLKIFGDPKKQTSSQLSYPGGLKVTLAGNKAGLWFDFGSHQGGGPIKAIQETLSLGFREALEVGAKIAGLPESQATEFDSVALQKFHDKALKIKEAEKLKTEQDIKSAASIWKGTVPLSNTLGNKYLNHHRKISDLTDSAIQFWPKGAVWLSTDDKGKEITKINKIPAIVVKAIDKNGQVTGVQRIYLDERTGGKNTHMNDPKLSRGKINGSVGIVRKIKNAERLYIAEGPETAASIAMADKKSTVLVSLGVHNLLKIEEALKQFSCKNIIIAADNDGSGAKTYETTLQAAQQLKAGGFDVSVIQPKAISGLSKTDWNDVLQKQGVGGVKKQLLSTEAILHDVEHERPNHNINSVNEKNECSENNLKGGIEQANKLGLVAKELDEKLRAACKQLDNIEPQKEPAIEKNEQSSTVIKQIIELDREIY